MKMRSKFSRRIRFASGVTFYYCSYDGMSYSNDTGICPSCGRQN